MCVHCTVTIVAHNTAQKRPDNFPSYPPDNWRNGCLITHRRLNATAKCK